ncbi:interferon alpha-inducible protein 27-like protein 2A [Heptranchias perlo]|uniref:interferon alpha-inducible protein 27-like protein 2A n=1 Tax=Heptranchias perlo TaxID=212740 RepID=UPI00355937CC
MRGRFSEVGQARRQQTANYMKMGFLLILAAGIGAGTSIVAAPVVLGVLGFTSAGIAVGSVAASMMSTAAVANGGAVAAGSTVAVLQSIGAAGLSAVGSVAVGTVGGAIASALLLV